MSTNTFGTITYMPPELLTLGHLTKAADVYSMGIIMGELYSSKVMNITGFLDCCQCRSTPLADFNAYRASMCMVQVPQVFILLRPLYTVLKMVWMQLFHVSSVLLTGKFMLKQGVVVLAQWTIMRQYQQPVRQAR